MDYRVAYYMHIGLRGNQEDCIFVNGEIFQSKRFRNTHVQKVSGSTALFGVCDGMGGHAKGEFASRFVCEKLKEYLKQFTFSTEFIRNIFSEIQEKTVREDIRNSGTTVACVACSNGSAKISNAGDSRVYKITKEDIVYLSHDHSYVQNMVDEGYLSQNQAFTHPHRNIIQFGIGDVFKNQWDKNDMQIHITDDVLGNDEYYLICTDGVNDIMRDDEIKSILYPDPFAHSGNFIECLKERMKDNFSFIIVGKG
jgi:serine/threonine protein phosphatase PrpC